MSESSIHEIEWAMSDAEEQAWDDLWETDAARCCSCPSCNFYAPDCEQHKGEPCILRGIIEQIVAARLAPFGDLADELEKLRDRLRARSAASERKESKMLLGREASAYDVVLCDLRPLLVIRPGTAGGEDRG